MWRSDPPLHRYLHTYAGGIAMGLVSGLLMFALVSVAVRVPPARWKWVDELTSATRGRLLAESLAAGLLGGVTHVLLDSCMHRDMRPFWPLLEGNTLAGVVGVGELHLGLALTGFLGMCLWLFQGET